MAKVGGVSGSVVKRQLGEEAGAVGETEPVDVGAAGAAVVAGVPGQALDVIEAAAPKGRAIGLLQGDDVRGLAPKQAGDGRKIGADGGGALEELLAAVGAAMGKVQAHDAKNVLIREIGLRMDHNGGHRRDTYSGSGRGEGEDRTGAEGEERETEDQELPQIAFGVRLCHGQ